MTHSSQRSDKKPKPLESDKSAPHKKGAQLFKKMHDRDKGGHQHTPYSRRSKREKTGTILAPKALEGEENYTVTCTEEEKVANEMDTNPGEAPNDHN